MVGSARCADRTPQRGVPTVVLARIDFERLANDVISSEANISVSRDGQSMQK
jgi:hypothetical protein